MRVLLSVILAFAIGVSWVAGALAGDLVAYGVDGWKYMQVSWSDPLHSQFYLSEFDDSAWAVGQGGFGSGVGDFTCPIQASTNTSWSLNTDMLLRRHFVADPARPVTVYVAIDNDVTVYVNGILVGEAATSQCAYADKYSVSVPQGLVVQGSNVLAVVAHDTGVEAYVDVRLEGSFPVATQGVTWGSIKGLFDSR